VGRGRLSAAAGLGRDSLRLLNAAFSNRSLIEIKLFRDSAHHLRRLAFRVTHVVKIIEHLTGLRRHVGGLTLSAIWSLWLFYLAYRLVAWSMF